MFWNYFSSSRFCVAQRSLTVTSSCMFRPRADSCTGHVVQIPLRNCQQTHGSIAPRHALMGRPTLHRLLVVHSTHILLLTSSKMLSVGTTTIQTSLIGGSTPGTAFNDAMAENWPAEMMIDLKHPIVEMRFRCGWIIDGFSRPTGSTDTTGMNVLLNDYENVVAVFGRAGRQSYYNRNMINSMGLVIFDSAKASMRIVGPFGNSNGSNNGEPFYVTDPLLLRGTPPMVRTTWAYVAFLSSKTTPSRSKLKCLLAEFCA
ncbi:hypothetical protein A0H81_03343 [Grifola frondosa]|uniref:Uncharacterized protein n=1 Tax=Grifola frondosa TaxID=5627 RepID=A0A1C7MK05_GRIFR|nr:hypothetical protein A0H81_03343 [Grifola frondosa]